MSELFSNPAPKLPMVEGSSRKTVTEGVAPAKFAGSTVNVPIPVTLIVSEVIVYAYALDAGRPVVVSKMAVAVNVVGKDSVVVPTVAPTASVPEDTNSSDPARDEQGRAAAARAITKQVRSCRMEFSREMMHLREQSRD